MTPAHAAMPQNPPAAPRPVDVSHRPGGGFASRGLTLRRSGIHQCVTGSQFLDSESYPVETRLRRRRNIAGMIKNPTKKMKVTIAIWTSPEKPVVSRIATPKPAAMNPPIADRSHNRPVSRLCGSFTLSITVSRSPRSNEPRYPQRSRFRLQ